MCSVLLFFFACGTSQVEIQKNTKSVDDSLSIHDSKEHLDENIQKTIRQLSVYDGDIVCESLPEKDRQSTLTYIVENVSRPPWAPMRAATCLAKVYPEEAQEELVRWVGNSKTKGLALLITKQIHTLPTAVAQRVASAGLKGPFAEELRVRLIKQNDERLRELLKNP